MILTDLLYKIIVSAAVLFLVLCTSCKGDAVKPTSEDHQESTAFPQVYADLLEVHGGLKKWKSLQSLEYYLLHQDGRQEKHHVDLHSRDTYIDHDSYFIIKNRDTLFSSPGASLKVGQDLSTYHNKYSYFLTLPFMLADPNVSYRLNDTFRLRDTAYLSMTCTHQAYDQDDNKSERFTTLVEPRSGRLRYVIYDAARTVAGGQSYIISYTNYQIINGFALPGCLTWYRYKSGRVGGQVECVYYEQVDLSYDKLERETFYPK